MSLLRTVCGLTDVAHLSSQEVTDKILEVLNKSDPGAAAPSAASKHTGNTTESRKQLDVLLTQNVVMRALEFFEANNLSVATEFCGAYQELTRNLGSALTSYSAANPISIAELALKVADEVCGVTWMHWDSHKTKQTTQNRTATPIQTTQATNTKHVT